MLAVVSAHFNFDSGYLKPVQNLDITSAVWKSTGVPYFVAEACYHDQRLEYPRADLRIPADSALWYKESLINAMVRQLPPEYTDIIVTDSDILWRDMHWVQTVPALLRQVPMVQLWTRMQDLSEHGAVNQTSWSRGSRPVEYGYFGAMAFHREFFDFIGLYDKLVTGPNDVVLTGGLEGDTNVSVIHELRKLGNTALADDAASWVERAHRYLRGDILCLNETVQHLWHGDKVNRSYSQRQNLISRLDPEKDLIRTHEGLLSFQDVEKKPHLQSIEDYFLTSMHH